MPRRRHVSYDAAVRALRLGRDVQAADTIDLAIARILAKVHEFTNAGLVFLVERNARGSLEITARAPGATATPRDEKTALADAEAALGRQDDRTRRAALEGKPVRNVGTDDSTPVPSDARALWNGSSIFGAVAIVKGGGRSFAGADLSIFTGLIDQASMGLAKRYVRPSVPDAGLEEEKKRVAEKPVSRSRIETIQALAREILVGQGRQHEEVLVRAERLADSDLAVLIRGETGTGKDCVARLIHEASPRREGPLVVVNIASIPATLFESQLFGHRKGAFTGADKDFIGLVRLADGGTLFVDEIGDLPRDLQSKLLRTIQQKTVIPVGETAEIPVDFRLVAATNANLEELVRLEKVRSDFYYRIGLAVIELAPLRERMGDLDLLVPHFLERCRGPGPPAALTEDAWAKLRGHDWRGNVRELEGVISTAYVLAGKKGPITAHHIELPSLAGPEPARHDPLDPGVVAKVVDDLKGNQSEAARILGVDRKTIARKLGKT